MAYTFPIEPKAMFEDRAPEFITLGVPADDLAKMRDTITDMWSSGPGGWVRE
jgi:esterase FrsA